MRGDRLKLTEPELRNVEDEKADLDRVRDESPPATDREVRLLKRAADPSRIRWYHPISRKPLRHNCHRREGLRTPSR